MNKRQRKKTGLILPKKIKDLVRRYSALHLNQDVLGGTFDYGYTLNSSGIGEDVLPYATLTDNTNTKIYEDCFILYKYVNCLVGTWFGEYTCGFVDNCRNYRIVRDFGTKVEFVEKTPVRVSYYVYQTGSDDNYSGTIYIPLRNKKFLAYDFTC